jgi:DNA-binding transcriptional LysR family regulator
MIDVRTAQLRSFLVLAEELHFGRAATRLGIAQSALSAQLRRLEHEVGAELLVRTSRSVRLTAAGDEVRAGAERVLADIDLTARRACAAHAGRVGLVRVGGMGASMIGLVPRVVHRLRAENPGLVVEVHELQTQDGLQAVAAGTIDIAFVRGLETYPGLRRETVYSEPVRAVLPTSHPLAERASLALSDLEGESLVLWPRESAPDFHDQIVSACHRSGFTPVIAHEVVGSVGRQAFVAARLGVGLEAAAYACARHRDVRFVPLDGDPLISRIDAVWRDGPRDPRRDLVLDAARTAGRRLA